MKPLLIGLTGKAGAGKDTAGGIFSRDHGFELYAFAWPLKSGLEAMFDLPPQVWLPEHKEEVIPWIGKSPRQLMQTLGTEWGRQFVHQDIWTRVMQHRWETVQVAMSNPRMCITDVRFDNEAEAVKKRRGIIVHIVRSAALPVSAHVSEAGVDPYYVDFTLSNDGTLLALAAGVQEIMRRLGA